MFNIKIGNDPIPNKKCPKYHGIKIDRALTFKKHLEVVKNKLKTQNNIITKLVGTGWGSKAAVLQTSN